LARRIPGNAPGILVGGLYGVHIGAAFFAESKFSLPLYGGTDASKVSLVHLIAHLQRRGFTLLDTQFWNPHIDQFGCREIPRAEYMARLSAAVDRPIAWGALAADSDRARLRGA
jgi:leucyl/phenylalanyl-tRNA--protein transferase